MENMKAYVITIKRADGMYEQDIIISDKVDEDKLEKKAIDIDCTIMVHEIGEVTLYDDNDKLNAEYVKIYNGKGEFKNDKI